MHEIADAPSNTARPASLASRVQEELSGHLAASRSRHAAPRLLLSPRQEQLVLAARRGTRGHSGNAQPVAPRGISVQRPRGLDTSLSKPRSMKMRDFKLWQSTPPVVEAKSVFPPPPSPDINEGREKLVRFSGWHRPKPLDSLHPGRVLLMPACRDCVVSSTREPLTSELFAFRVQDRRGRTTVKTCDLRQVCDFRPCLHRLSMPRDSNTLHASTPSAYKIISSSET